MVKLVVISPNKQTIDIYQALDVWLEYLRVGNFSKHTLSAYQADVFNFAFFLQQSQLCINTVDNNHVQRFISQRLEQDALSNASVQRELSCLRQFFSWCLQNNYIDNDPFVGASIKTASRNLPEMVDIEVIHALLDQAPPDTKIATQKQQQLWVRDKAILELIYSSGLRVSEVVQLHIQDVDVNSMHIRIEEGKGNKTRLVPLGHKALLALQQWLALRDTQNLLSDYIFVGADKQKPLTTRTVQRRIQVQAQRAGIDKRMYPHLLRHCFASHMLSSSGDLRAVQELLGHANISTTQIYTHLDFEKLASVYDASHPRAKK